MDKQSFKSLCHTLFTSRGFRKWKSMYYQTGRDGILCGLWLKKSNYGPAYTIIYYYFFGQTDAPKKYPTYTEYDLAGYINVMSKDTVRGKYYLTGTIAYELYSEEELLPYLNIAFDEYILPPIHIGKIHILENNSHLTAHHSKNKSDLLAFLCD